MRKSTRAAADVKLRKPHPDFPLFQHQTGRWCKKVKGRLVYLGKVADDPRGEKALELWNASKDEIFAGRKPRLPGNYPTVKLLVDRFLAFKESRVESGELAQRTFDRYYSTGRFIADEFGRNRDAGSLGPEDFADLRRKMAKRWGPVALANEIQMVRCIFNY